MNSPIAASGSHGRPPSITPSRYASLRRQARAQAGQTARTVAVLVQTLVPLNNPQGGTASAPLVHALQDWTAAEVTLADYMSTVRE